MKNPSPIRNEANLDFVIDRLATGGDLSDDEDVAADQLGDLIDQGVSHILDCREEWSDELLVAEVAPWITYLHMGVDDHGGCMPPAWYEQGTEWVGRVLEDPDAKVLVHCHMGVNRGPSMAFASMLRLGHDPVEAIDAIRTARPIAGVLYAEDALAWWHRRQDTPTDDQEADRRRLSGWRKTHRIDVARMIRQMRDEEQEGR